MCSFVCLRFLKRLSTSFNVLTSSFITFSNFVAILALRRTEGCHSNFVFSFVKLSVNAEIVRAKIKDYSQLSPCGHPSITETPIIRTTAKSQAKINYRRLTEVNSRYYGLSVMRTLTRGPYSVRNK